MIDLANEIIKESYKPPQKNRLELNSVRTALSVRLAMQEAKRFVLDESMSEMLGHLSTAPYNDSNLGKGSEALTTARRSSRLPFPKMFVQYDGQAFRRGLINSGEKKDMWGAPLVDASQVVDPVGWLFERSLSSNGITCTEYLMLDSHAATIPFCWVWSPDDLNLTEHPFSLFKEEGGAEHRRLTIDTSAGQLAHGITGCFDPSCGVIYMNDGGLPKIPKKHLVEVKDPDRKVLFKIHYLVAEIGGALRYMFAFLSTLNEIPVSYERQRPTKSYLANGRIRTAVDHEVIRLTLPNRTIKYREFARNLMKEKQRHKDHPVKGHWRTFQAQPGYQCVDETGHVWGPTDATGHADCLRCETSRTWIRDHRRGDKSLGTVEHKYAVTARSSDIELAPGRR